MWFSPPGDGFVGGALLVADDRAVLELDDPPPQVVDDVVVVGGHDDGGAGAVDPVEQPDDVEADRAVEVSGRLVAEQDLRPVHHGPGDGDALLLTAGELVGEALLLAVRGRPSRGSRAPAGGSGGRACR